MANVTSITVARRHVQWSDTRWAWKRGVRQDASLSDAAKVLAAALCDDWANHDSGFCNPSVATLAKALGKAERSIQRSIAALKAAGWLDTVVRGRGDRGGNGKGDQGSEFVFLMAQPKAPETAPEPAENEPENVTQLAPFREKGDTQRVTPVTVKGDIRVVSPCTPYKDKPTLNQGARAGGGGSKPTKATASGQRVSSDSPEAVERGFIQFWAKTIRDGGYVAPSVVAPHRAQAMLSQGLVTEAELRSAGVGW